jgi:hypothetical protein
VWKTRSLAVVGTVCIWLLVTGCSNNAVFDLAPLGSFLDLRVENDTGDTVAITDCSASKCHRNGGGFNDTLKAYAAREEAAWLNATPGVAAVRVSRDGATIGCFRVRYRKGQQHATARVSEAAPC